mgnify:FL=1
MLKMRVTMYLIDWLFFQYKTLKIRLQQTESSLTDHQAAIKELSKGIYSNK